MQNSKQQTTTVYDIHIYQNIEPAVLDNQINNINGQHNILLTMRKTLTLREKLLQGSQT
jgi:hypothetical protein